MSEPQGETPSQTAQLLDHIEALHVDDLRNGALPLTVEGIYRAQAFPYSLVLSAAALRAEGVAVTQKQELRVVTFLGVPRDNWISAIANTHATLGTEATQGDPSDSLSVSLGEESLKTVRSRTPVGFYAVQMMVKLAADQDRALTRQAGIVMHNFNAELLQSNRR